MKKFGLVILFLALNSGIYAQTAQNLLHHLPPVPASVCNMTGEQKNEYLSEVRKVLDQLKEQISKKNKAQKEYVKQNKEAIEKEMMEKTGLSASDAQKMKNKKLSKEEKKAIAEKMMEEKTGISMTEIENLKKMSKEGKKNWAEAYATQQQANLSNGGGDEKSPDQTAMENNMKKSAETAKLAKELQTIMNRISASDKKFTLRLMEVQKKDSVERISLEESLKPIYSKMNALPGPSEEEGHALCLEIQKLERAHCTKISPAYLNALKDAEIFLKANLGDYKRLGEINAKLNEATIGNSLQSLDSDNLMELEAVESYASNLLNVFKYAKVTSCSSEANNQKN